VIYVVSDSSGMNTAGVQILTGVAVVEFSALLNFVGTGMVSEGKRRGYAQHLLIYYAILDGHLVHPSIH